ncbi:hypothetical protein GCM10027590_23580 [Nocardiopsis nanhaiensis]
MSFGALPEEAKTALATGADHAATGICSGEGGMLPEEQAANGRYFYELASAGFGFSTDKVARSRPSTSRETRPPRRGPAATRPGTRSGAASQRYANCPKGKVPCHRPASPT